MAFLVLLCIVLIIDGVVFLASVFKGTKRKLAHFPS